MHHLGMPTTRALSLVRSGEEVVRDMFYDGNPQREPGAIVCRVAPSFLRFGSYEIFTSRAELDVLFDRVKKRTHRPLLRQGDPKEILARLMQQRYPIYAEADIVVDSTAQPAERTTEQVIEAIRAYLHAQTPGHTT